MDVNEMVFEAIYDKLKTQIKRKKILSTLQSRKEMIESCKMDISKINEG